LELVRVNDRILAAAGVIPPAEMRSHDAIHVVTAQQFGNDLGQLVTYDDRMASVANGLGLRVAAPS
jgi:predicted nucleic acid-binding protein